MNKRGFTLIELLIVVAIVAVLGLVVASACKGGVGRVVGDKGAAQESLHEWADTLYGQGKWKGMCTEADTDGDGYVSCSIVVAGNVTPVPVECAGKLTLQKGCRTPKVVIPTAGGR